MAQAEATATFNDAAAYERFMGRWSRAVGATFLDWLAPPTGARWLDVGCGTGAFTEMVLGRCAPARIDAVDPSAEQIEYAREQPAARTAHFQVGDALNLPFPDAAFDVVASALVLNFVPDRPRGLAEMRRVARRGGLVAAYVWDFAGGRSTNWPLGKAIHAAGCEMPPVAGTRDSSLDALQALFRDAGFEAVEARAIEITPAFRSFDEMWTTQVPAFSPMGKFVRSLSEAQRQQVKDIVRGMLPPKADGSISYAATANAVKGRVKG